MSPVLPWPRVIPKPSQDSGTPSDSLRSQLVFGANGRPLPIVFGPRIVSGILSDIWPHGGGLIYCFKFCVGPIKSYEWIKLNGTLIQDVLGVGYNAMLGVPSQSSGLLLTSAHWPDYYERFPYEAYIEVGVDSFSDVLGGNLQIQAKIEGLNNVFDHRTNSYGYSTNPAVCCAHLLMMPTGGHLITTNDIHWDSWDAAANWCDELIEAGDKRWELSAIVDSPATVLQHVTNILASCRIRPVWKDGKLGVVWNKDNPPADHTIDLSWIAASENGHGPLQLREFTTEPEQHPTVVHVTYPDLSRDGESVTQTLKASGVDSGTVAYRESSVSSAHITRVAVAARLADDLLRKAAADLRCWALCLPRAHVAQPGECVEFANIPEFGNLAAKKWIVDEVLLRPDGLVELNLSEPYINSTAKKTALSTGSIIVNRVDPKTPNDVPSITDVIPPITGLTLSTITSEVGGITSYSILAQWNRSTSIFVVQYLIEVTVGGALVWSGSSPAYTPACTIPVEKPGQLHVVSVCAINASGRRGASSSATITPGVAMPTISLLSSNKYTVNALMSQNSTLATRGTLYWPQWTVSSNPNSIAYFVLYDENGDFAVLDSATRGVRVTPVAQINSPTATDYIVHVVNSYIGLRAILNDGREIDKGQFTFSLFGPSAENLASIDNDQLFRWDAANATLRPLRTGTPALGALPYKWSDGWGYVKLTGDNGMIPAGSSSTLITHGLTFASASYLVIVCSRDGVPVWAEPVSQTQIRVYRTGTSGDQAFSYLVVGA